MKNGIMRCFLSFVLVLASSSSAFAFDVYAPVTGNGLSSASIAFLQEHNVDLSVFPDQTQSTLSESGLALNNPNDYDSAVISLIRQTEANGFTDEQVQAYVQGLVDYPTTVAGIPSGFSTMAANKPNEDGVGYEVLSKTGYYESTAYAYVPSVSVNSNTSAYMFFTVNGIDLGIWYQNGTGGYSWRGFYTMPSQELESDTSTIPLSSGSYLYFHVTVTTNNYVRLRVLDGNNFNNVYYDISCYTSTSRSNSSINRQITLTDSAKSFNNGRYCRNAKFTQAYLYNASTTNLCDSNNTVSTRVGSFGTNNTTAQKVTVNSYTAWSAENVSINF